MATCNICKYAGRPTYKSPCSECKDFSKYEYENKKTNADIIRYMSDEELCNWLFRRDCTNIASFLEYGGMGVMNAVQLLEWLKQPYEGE